MKNSISKPRILVVEDQEAMRNLLADYLEQNEFEVVTCGDASDALEKLGIVTEAGDSEKIAEEDDTPVGRTSSRR